MAIVEISQRFYECDVCQKRADFDIWPDAWVWMSFVQNPEENLEPYKMLICRMCFERLSEFFSFETSKVWNYFHSERRNKINENR